MDGSPDIATERGRAGIALRRRRAAFAAAVIGTSIALLALMAATLFISGPDPLGIAMLILFAVTLPWTTIGFWNAVIGFALMVPSRAIRREWIAPYCAMRTGDEKIASSTALLVCIHNEDTARCRATSSG
jgi:membrane glycosyltransferase